MAVFAGQIQSILRAQVSVSVWATVMLNTKTSLLEVTLCQRQDRLVATVIRELVSRLGGMRTTERIGISCAAVRTSLILPELRRVSFRSPDARYRYGFSFAISYPVQLASKALMGRCL